MTTPTAALLIIGNEILSGRTQDKNLNYIAKELGNIGVRFMEVRVIPDIEDTIIHTLNALRETYDYVFTTGGIGPTHDDITSLSVAKAFGVALARHEDSYSKMHAYYEDKGGMNEARIKMSLLPEGAEPIYNPVSIAPGFRMENVYVMAGIPNIMQAMFDSFKGSLVGGAVIESREVKVFAAESKIAQPLGNLQAEFPAIDIGSYPFVEGSQFGTVLVLRGSDIKKLEQAHQALLQLLTGMGIVPA